MSRNARYLAKNDGIGEISHRGRHAEDLEEFRQILDFRHYLHFWTQVELQEL